MTQEEIEQLKAANEGHQNLDATIRMGKTIENRVLQDWLDMFSRINDLEANLQDARQENFRLSQRIADITDAAKAVLVHIHDDQMEGETDFERKVLALEEIIDPASNIDASDVYGNGGYYDSGARQGRMCERDRNIIETLREGNRSLRAKNAELLDRIAELTEQANAVYAPYREQVEAFCKERNAAITRAEKAETACRALIAWIDDDDFADDLCTPEYLAIKQAAREI